MKYALIDFSTQPLALVEVTDCIPENIVYPFDWVKAKDDQALSAKLKAIGAS